jgi:hypothetical protein
VHLQDLLVVQSCRCLCGNSPVYYNLTRKTARKTQSGAMLILHAHTRYDDTSHEHNHAQAPMGVGVVYTVRLLHACVPCAAGTCSTGKQLTHSAAAKGAPERAALLHLITPEAPGMAVELLLLRPHDGRQACLLLSTKNSRLPLQRTTTVPSYDARGTLPCSSSNKQATLTA